MRRAGTVVATAGLVAGLLFGGTAAVQASAGISYNCFNFYGRYQICRTGPETDPAVFPGDITVVVASNRSLSASALVAVEGRLNQVTTCASTEAGLRAEVVDVYQGLGRHRSRRAR